MDFLELTIRRNPQLIHTAASMHQNGLIPANTVVVDLDTLRKNALAITESAKNCGISLYQMTKQFGRNPEMCNVIRDAGVNKAVAVDSEDVHCLIEHGIPIGHVGHLVQVSRADIEYVLSRVRPEVITVFSFEKARQIADVANRLSVFQKLLIRVVARGDFFYANQFGGIPEEEVSAAVRRINELESVGVVGVTSFPCFRFNVRDREVVALPNMYTVLRAAERLKKESSIDIEQINAPGDNSAQTLSLLARLGATHAEPGHGFTGTTPWHMFEDLPELPAWVYVTEVSHTAGNNAYAIGGGLMSGDSPLNIWTALYHGNRLYALIGDDPDSIMDHKVCADPAGYIDYYGTLHLSKDTSAKVGDTVIYGLRNQVFLSRTQVAIVSGITNCQPLLVGIFDRTGRRVVRNN